MSPLEKAHTLSVFDDELGRIRATVDEMADLAATALTGAMAALESGDAGDAAAIVAGDAHIDALETDLEKQVVRSLALRAPMADDLRYLVMVIRIGAMLERAGDHAKNIAKRVPDTPLQPGDALMALLRDMSGLARAMLEQSVDSLNRRDAALALEVRRRDADMNNRYAELTRLITREMQGEPGFVPAGVQLLFVAKQLERTGDYATNIANCVHYLVTGAHFPGRDEGAGEQARSYQ